MEQVANTVITFVEKSDTVFGQSREMLDPLHTANVLNLYRKELAKSAFTMSTSTGGW